jgi:hypothetical protein
MQCHTAKCVQRALEGERDLGLQSVRVIADGHGLSLCGSVETPEQREQVLAYVQAICVLRVRSLLSVGAPVLTSAAGSR